MSSNPTLINPLINFQSSVNNHSTHLTNSETKKDLFKIGSINANNSLKKNIDLYIDFFIKENFDILCIQEPGPFIPQEDTSNSTNDLTTLYELKLNNIISFSNINTINRYSLITLVSNSLAPIIRKNSSYQHIQSLTCQSEKGPIDIINIYIPHDSTSATETVTNLTRLKTLNQSIIVCGDLNSFSNPNLDYFSNCNYEKKKKNLAKKKSKLFNKITENLTDAFRLLNPSKKSFTKWTINSENQPPTVTASRLDYILISNNLIHHLTSSAIHNENKTNSDHIPIDITLNIEKIKRKTTNNTINHKTPHFSLWPISLHHNIEKDLNLSIQNLSISSTENIEFFALSLTNIIQNNWNNYLKSIPILSKKSRSFQEIKQIKNLRKSLLKTQKVIKKSLTSSLPITDINWNKIKNKYYKITNQTTLTSISSSLSNSSIILILNKAINITTNFLHKTLKKIKNINLHHKLDNLLKSKDLSTKLIYRLLKNKDNQQEINYYIDSSSTPNKLILNPKEIKNFIEQKYISTFNNSSTKKDISFWTKCIPKIPSNYSININFSKDNIIKTLSTRQNSAPGPDSIQFDIFKYLKKHNSSIFTHISYLYQKMFELNFIPEIWKEGTTTLIPKTDNITINNWRPITLLNTLYKGFTLILNSILQKSLTDNDIIPQEQCGFNKNQDTSIAISSFIETIKSTHFNNIPLHCIFIDFKTAFDSVQHWVIEDILNHIEINHNLKNTILNLMSNSYTRIKTIDGLTNKIDLKTGVKQGDPLSPTLFLLYLLPIQWVLKIFLPKTIHNYNHLCYADDMILLSHDRQTINSLFLYVTSYATYTNMQINEKKSAYSYTNDLLQSPLSISIPNLNQQLISLKLNTLLSYHNYKYLGLDINLNLDFSSLSKHIIEIYKKCLNIICRKKFLGINLIIKLINTIAIPKISYYMYFIMFPKQTLLHLDNITNIKLCQTFKIPTSTKNEFWQTTYNLYSLKSINEARYINNIFDRGLNSSSPLKLNTLISNHITLPITTYNSLPTISSILSTFNINIIQKTTSLLPNNPSIPNINHIQIFTDASYIHSTKKGCCAILIPLINQSFIFKPFLPASSTNLELFAILKALEIFESIPEIEIFTDSNSSILAINNFPNKSFNSQLKSPLYPILNAINMIIERKLKKSPHSLKFHHIYSHLLDKTKPTNFKNKLITMKKNFKNNYLFLLKQNQKCDILTNQQNFDLKPLPENFYGLPNFSLSHNSSIYCHSKQILSKIMSQQKKEFLIEKEKKRSLWIKSNLCNSILTTKSKSIQFQRIFPKLCQSLMFTKKRAYPYYQKANKLPPQILLKRKNAYNNEFCHLCNNTPDNHEHGNSSCAITKFIHNKMTEQIINTINSYKPKNNNWSIPLWFTNSYSSKHINNNPSPFPNKWGDIGIIPLSINKTIQTLKVNQPKKLINHITNIIHSHIAAKWKLKFFALYNKNLSLNEICDDSNLEKFLKSN